MACPWCPPVFQVPALTRHHDADQGKEAGTGCWPCVLTAGSALLQQDLLQRYILIGCCCTGAEARAVGPGRAGRRACAGVGEEAQEGAAGAEQTRQFRAGQPARDDAPLPQGVRAGAPLVAYCKDARCTWAPTLLWEA